SLGPASPRRPNGNVLHCPAHGILRRQRTEPADLAATAARCVLDRPHDSRCARHLVGLPAPPATPLAEASYAIVLTENRRCANRSLIAPTMSCSSAQGIQRVRSWAKRS